MYDRKKIADELFDTALGSSFYGNALRVAKDLPELSDHDRSVLDAYANGKQAKFHAPHLMLQDVAIKILKARKEAENEKN
jgi:hypothetical protein